MPKARYFDFTIRKHKLVYEGVAVGDFSNCWYTPREVVDYMWQFEVPDSKLFAYVKKGKDICNLVSDLGYFPEKLRDRMKAYGIKPTWANWHKLEDDCHGNSLSTCTVAGDVESMTDRQVRNFVRKHGPKNLKVYFELHCTLDRATDPETRGYFGNSPEERRQQVNNVWRAAAYQMTGMDFDEACEMAEDMR